ncbi:hypothetical protein [Pedobacter sp. MC2016-24]|uniref:hypothetical protein n=1 Tax=Pedobacter sp. MC2016-24 TaxID=2780090 RepID=UPI00187F8DF8|nr:hypothetical protein [Pedobacter sp. MC2016-24]MBE9598419.1 hypothetical protein [Pedobacter sp. MC2016-24]
MNRNRVLSFQVAAWLSFSIAVLSACNPFPKKDTHPEVPFLMDLVKDNTKFVKVIGHEHLSELIFLKDDRILIKPDNSNIPFKIMDLQGKLIIAQVFDWKLPFYVDKQGNLYFNREKYNYPDYKQHAQFKTVVFKDSIDKKSEALGDQFPDSVKFKMIDAYEVKLLQPYGLKPCEYQVVNQEKCHVFEVRNNTLLVRQDELFKSDFSRAAVEADRFDDDVLIRWENGRIASPRYMSYYQIGQYKAKCDDGTLPTLIKIKGQNYLFAYALGLFLIK